MNEQLILELSDADAIAGDEDEVRAIIRRECLPHADEVLHDGLGSIVFHKRGPKGAPKVLFMAHMDEVGFVVRSISDIGMLYLLPVGGVIDKSKDMQLVRVTTFSGEKYRGVLNVTRDAVGKVVDTYVDLGVSSADEVRTLGVAEGNRVCFDTTASVLVNGVVVGKAMDDRTGCYVITETIRQLCDSHSCDLYFAGTSSEEVGLRGGKTVTELVVPDLAIAVDTANCAELDRGFENHRLLGHGPMIEHYDKTMSPNRRMLAFVRDLLDSESVPYQRDMFGGGGTDAGASHLVGTGCLAMVLGVPLRYCHGSCSLAHPADIDAAVRVALLLCERLDSSALQSFLTY